MDIENSLQKKIEEVKPGEKGGGEEDMEEVVKGETKALVEVVLESDAGVEAEGQTTGALVEGVLESGEGEAWDEDAGDLGAAQGAGEAVEEDAGALVGVVPGAGEAVEEDAGALLGAAPGAGEALEEGAGGGAGEVVGGDTGALRRVAPEAGDAVQESDPVVKEVERESAFEMRGEKERGIWRVASLDNRLDQSLFFQTAGMHVKNSLFGVGQQNEWCVVRPVSGAIPAGSGMATTAGWQASGEPRVGGADGPGVGVGRAGDHTKGQRVSAGRAGLRGSRSLARRPGGRGGNDWALGGGRRGWRSRGGRLVQRGFEEGG